MEDSVQGSRLLSTVLHESRDKNEQNLCERIMYRSMYVFMQVYGEQVLCVNLISDRCKASHETRIRSCINREHV